MIIYIYIYIFSFLFLFLLWKIFLVYQKDYQLRLKKRIGNIVVKYIEQYYPDIKKEEKYVLARDIFLEVLNYYKITILETELDLIIESEVWQLKKSQKKGD